jgi:excisionase family DNA binding protein
MKTLPAVEPRGLTMRQAAAYWGVSYNTFRKLIREGVAPAPIDLGLGRFIFDRTAMDAALESRSKPARVA